MYIGVNTTEAFLIIVGNVKMFISRQAYILTGGPMNLIHPGVGAAYAIQPRLKLAMCHLRLKF